ncbi:MAG TPA: DinB family protein [Bacteroidota bacterium]|nr:DinB family protein [Bacteroidota bacterium]
MNLHDIRTLFAFDQWATDRILDIVATLSEEQYVKNMNSSHGGVRGTLVHYYGAEWIWLERWKGTSPTALIKEEDIPTFPRLREKWTALRQELNQFVNTLTEEQLQSPLTYNDLKGNQYTQPLWQQMQHLINHSTYHRGQVVTLLRQLGVKPVATDLIAYYRTLTK